MSADHSERRRFDPSQTGKNSPPRRTSGGHAPVKRASGGQPQVKRTSGSVPTRAPSERISARPAPKPAPAQPAPVAQARPAAAKAKRTTGAQRPVAAETAAKPQVVHESRTASTPEKKISVATAPVGSSRRTWKALVGLLAAACVGLGATAGWLWLRSSAPASVKEAVTKSGSNGGDEPKVQPVSNSGRAPGAGDAVSAKFLARDDKTGGSWKKNLGKDGYVIFNKNGAGQHEVQLPAYISEVTCTGDCHIWSVNEEVRGLEDPNDPKKRYQTCIYSGSDFLLTVKTSRSVPYRLSLYSLDSDRLGRKQKVEVLDGDKVLHAQDVENMGEGVWITYEIHGSVDVRFTNLAANNAVLAGVFFDTEEGLKVPKRLPSKEPLPAAEQLKPGIWAEYFDQLATYANVKDVPTARRVEPGLCFGATQPLQPGQGMRGWPFADACAAIFSGYVKIAEDGAYIFFVASDDGARLYIDGELIVDNDGRHPMKEASKQVELKTGLHRIWIEYFNVEPPMGLNVYLQGKDGKKDPIPEGVLLYDPSEILSETTQAETAVARR